MGWGIWGMGDGGWGIWDVDSTHHVSFAHSLIRFSKEDIEIWRKY